MLPAQAEELSLDPQHPCEKLSTTELTWNPGTECVWKMDPGGALASWSSLTGEI